MRSFGEKIAALAGLYLAVNGYYTNSPTDVLTAVFLILSSIYLKGDDK